MAKVRPLFATINEKCLHFFLNDEHLSVDESMLPYYGRHSSKQRILGKPVGWDTRCGYWPSVTDMLCSLNYIRGPRSLAAQGVLEHHGAWVRMSC